MPGLLHTSDLNSSSVTQALTSPVPARSVMSQLDVTPHGHPGLSGEPHMHSLWTLSLFCSSPGVSAGCGPLPLSTGNLSTDQASDSLCSLRKPGEGVNLTGWPRVPRSPSRCEVVFYGPSIWGWLDPLVLTGGGLLDPLEKTVVPTQPDGTYAWWGTAASMRMGEHRKPHTFSWGSRTRQQVSETFCRKDVSAEEG